MNETFLKLSALNEKAIPDWEETIMDRHPNRLGKGRENKTRLSKIQSANWAESPRTNALKLDDLGDGKSN